MEFIDEVVDALREWTAEAMSVGGVVMNQWSSRW